MSAQPQTSSSSSSCSSVMVLLLLLCALTGHRGDPGADSTREPAVVSRSSRGHGSTGATGHGSTGARGHGSTGARGHGSTGENTRSEARRGEPSASVPRVMRDLRTERASVGMSARDIRKKEMFIKHLTGPLYFSPKCRKHVYTLYHNTRDCTKPAYFKRCARLLRRLAGSPQCSDR